MSKQSLMVKLQLENLYNIERYVTGQINGQF
jgi:hypothetical protein